VWTFCWFDRPEKVRLTGEPECVSTRTGCGSTAQIRGLTAPGSPRSEPISSPDECPHTLCTSHGRAAQQSRRVAHPVAERMGVSSGREAGRNAPPDMRSSSKVSRHILSQGQRTAGSRPVHPVRFCQSTFGMHARSDASGMGHGRYRRRVHASVCVVPSGKVHVCVRVCTSKATRDFAAVFRKTELEENSYSSVNVVPSSRHDPPCD